MVKVKATLTKQQGEHLKVKITDECGWMACVAVDEVFQDAQFHGQNLACELVNENDHIIVVLDSDCSPKSNHRTPKERNESIMTELCQQGIVVYYYHTIKDKHHHVCLALKKKSQHAMEITANA